MSEVYEALAVSLDEDLLPLSVLLHQRGLPHRIIEERGEQVLKVTREDHVQAVRTLYQAWRSGEVAIELTKAPAQPARAAHTAVWRNAPVTLLLIALSIAGFVLVYFAQSVALVGLLSFLPVTIENERLVFGELAGQYWRLVTPIFLHFGWLHIAFNCLWLWELGRRIESEMGHFNTLMLCLVIAVVSNVSQFVYGGPGLFGGMSGVVYGLLGFAWVAPILQPAWPIQPRGSIMLFMVGWLVLCLVGVVETLGFGSIANAAHVGGLVCGALLGLVFGFAARLGDAGT